MIVKTLIPLFLLVGALTEAKVEIPDDLQEYIDEIHDLCLKQIGLTEDDHKKFDIDHKDPKMMCYLQCLMKTSKWMNPDGSINYEHIVENAHDKVKHLLVPAINQCREIQEGKQECETAYNFNVCMFHADPENWFFV